MNKKVTATLIFLTLAIVAFPLSAQEPQDTTAEETAQEESTTVGYFRIDTDGLGTQFWVGATHDLGNGIGLSSDIYVVDFSAELDLGISFSLGPVALLPMAGIVFNFLSDEDEAVKPKTISLVVPQLFTIIDMGVVYFESWIQVFLNDMWTEGAADSFYTRDFILLNIMDIIAVGPQIELTYVFNNAADEELASLPVGGRINVEYGEENTLGLFLGYDTKTEDLAGRFTFVRTW